jgi:uncharacterized membrane protein
MGAVSLVSSAQLRNNSGYLKGHMVEVTKVLAPIEKGFGHQDSAEGSEPVEARTARLPSIDVLRGFVMILMALDHTRDFFTNQSISLSDASHLTLPYFFTRWITHLCAPTFVFLAGLSAYLQLARGKAKAELSLFLFKRGCWLVFLQLTIVYFVLIGPPGISILQIIGAIGLSMIVLAGLVWLPLPAIAAVGLIIVAGHNSFDHVHAVSLGRWAALWKIAHERGFVSFHNRIILSVVYPFVPWSGVMALGYSFGRLWLSPVRQRIRVSACLGVLSIAIFVLLRAFHGYGDPNTWTSQHGIVPAITTFLNVEKYPPSLQYVSIMMGICLLLLACFDSLLSSNRISWTRSSLEVYGRVPLVYYIVHLALIHLLAIITCACTGHDWRRFTTPLPHGSFIVGTPPGYGFGLGGVYLIWIAIIASLYWPMKQYADYKRQHPEKTWLSYL